MLGRHYVNSSERVTWIFQTKRHLFLSIRGELEVVQNIIQTMQWQALLVISGLKDWRNTRVVKTANLHSIHVGWPHEKGNTCISKHHHLFLWSIFPKVFFVTRNVLCYRRKKVFLDTPWSNCYMNSNCRVLFCVKKKFKLDLSIKTNHIKDYL